MALGNGWFRKLFGKKEDDFFSEYDVDFDEEADSLNWNWDNLIKDRHLLKLSDEVQREKYIRSLVEQVKDASEQIDNFSMEYNAVTGTLRDMDELEALPRSEMEDLRVTAKEILEIEKEHSAYNDTKKLMTDGQFWAMERFSANMPKAYEDLKAAEEQRTYIKNDLRRLEDEKQGYLYRNEDLKNSVQNCRGMMIICVFAAFLCIVMLLVLQYVFKMNTKVGFAITALGVALAVVALYVKFVNENKELYRTGKAINRIILLQNTVKIRYINNKNLLDYLYTKYNTTSAKELQKIWDVYESEKELRNKHAENEMNLSESQNIFRKKLSKYHLSDIQTWVYNPQAVIDHKEMVEIRHVHILRRQKLRARLDYNKKMAREAQQELKQLIQEYPQYGREVMDMLERYS